MGVLVAAGVSHTTLEELEEDVAYTAKAVGEAEAPESLLSATEIAHVLLSSRGRGIGSWRVLVEPLLQELCELPEFRRIWDNDLQSTEWSVVKAAAENQLTGRFVTEPAEHAAIPWPGFVSPLGPSVYRCKCGVAFGDPNQELDNTVAEDLKKRRNLHFQEMF